MIVNQKNVHAQKHARALNYSSMVTSSHSKLVVVYLVRQKIAILPVKAASLLIAKVKLVSVNAIVPIWQL